MLTTTRNVISQNFNFLGLKSLSPSHVWGAHTDIIEFQNVMLQFKNQTSGSKTACGFSIILILKGLMTF